jgi:hypothetical protein
MATVHTRAWLRAAAGVLAFAAVGAPRDGVSQPPLAASSSDEQRELIARIEEEQLLHGVNAPDLIGPLTALALFYVEHGDRSLSMAAAERANAIVRMNFGLKTLEQAPLIRLLSQTEEAQGNLERAWELEQQLFGLVQQNPSDLGTVPILHDLAARRAGLLQRYRSGEIPPQIFFGCYYAGGPLQQHGASPCRNGSRRVALGALQDEAEGYKWSAVRTILRTDLYATGQLDELTAVAVDNCRRYRGDPLAACTDEIDLVDQLAYEVGSSVSRLDALIRTADWQLLGAPWWRPFRERLIYAPLVPGQLAPGSVPVADDVDNCGSCDAALETYRQAYEELKREGVAQAVIDRVFAPRLPVSLPGLRDGPFAEPVGGGDGYIDVAFDVTTQGRAMNVEIRAATPDASREEKFKLVHRIEGSRFRPITSNGEFADAVPVVVRYYLSNGPRSAQRGARGPLG